MRVRDFWKQDQFFPFVLLISFAFLYGLKITRLGFYWDDWGFVFLSRMSNPADYWKYFITDRPFSIWTYLITVPWLGMVPWRWQVFTIIVRWAAILAFCQVLVRIWPAHQKQIQWTGILLVVFPGFTQQTISVAYSQHFLTLLLFTSSLLCMVIGVQKPRQSLLWTILGCFLSLTSMLTMEYFVTLELIRPLILWLAILRTRGNREQAEPIITRVLIYWLPYLFMLIVFGVWRFVYFPRISVENTPTLFSEWFSDPVKRTSQLLQLAIQDFVHLIFSSWTGAIQPSQLDLKSLPSMLISIGTAILLTLWFVFRADPKESNSEDGSLVGYRFHREGFLLAILAILLGGIPVWSTNRQAITGLWSDRFSLGPMIGATLLVVVFVDWLIQCNHRKYFLLGAIFCISFFSQELTLQKYIENWSQQKDYYWQFFWRVPSLKKGTAIIAPKLPLSYLSDYAVGFTFNTIYSPTVDSPQVPYWFFIGPKILGEKMSVDQDTASLEYSLRNISFQGSYSESLVASYSPGRDCLRILDPVYIEAPPFLKGGLGSIERELYPISHTDRIEISKKGISNLPADIFGAEPEHGWCYYFQKADVARQFMEWNTIPTLAAQTQLSGLRTKNGTELIPFIYGFAMTGDWTKASEYSMDANRLTAGLQPALCSIWQDLVSKTPSTGEREITFQTILDEFACRGTEKPAL